MDLATMLTEEEATLADALRAVGLDLTAEAWAMETASELRKRGAHVCPGLSCTKHGDRLPDKARARHGDPDTSHHAALTIDNLSDRQMAVLTVAEMFGEPFTYDDLIWRYDCRRVDGRFPLHVQARLGRDYELPAQEPSSIRSRCAELRRAGFIVQDGRGESYAGRPCNTWRVA
jgi:hypothetical protein